MLNTTPLHPRGVKGYLRHVHAEPAEKYLSPNTCPHTKHVLRQQIAKLSRKKFAYNCQAPKTFSGGFGESAVEIHLAEARLARRCEASHLKRFWALDN